MSELKPCPHCNSDVEFSGSFSVDRRWFTLEMCCADIEARTEADAVKIFNTRPREAILNKKVETLEFTKEKQLRIMKASLGWLNDGNTPLEFRLIQVQRILRNHITNG